MKMFAPHAVDFYKTGHYKQYPENTTFVYSNFTPRSDTHAEMLPDFDHKVVFFGFDGVVQWLLFDLWNETFFYMPLNEVIRKLKLRMDGSLGPNAVSMDQWKALHNLGYLPILIKALPEGSRVPMRMPMFTIQNTEPEFFWLVNYLETQISAELWKSVTSATTAYEYRRLLDSFAVKTGSPLEFVPWQGHDFSARGMSGVYDAAQSGAGHLLSFTGTDTVAAIDYLEDYYFGKETFVGGSVPATEHSVMCMGGEDNEVDTILRLITVTYPTGIVSIVSDTWDFWNTIGVTTVTLKEQILSRQPDALGNAKVVFRPDSGDPVKIICGDPEAVPGSFEFKGAVETLWDIFGGTTTHTGHKVLDSHVGIIYGDSITLDRAVRILTQLEAKGFASCNIVFGIGSFTYQRVTRDTFGHAYKATFGTVDGEDRVLFKQPKTDNGMKFSARGLLRIEIKNGEFVLYENQTREQEKLGLLEPVFHDGRCFGDTLENIRNRLKTS